MKVLNGSIRTIRNKFSILCLAWFLVACGISNVVIQGNFSTPDINKMPLSVAVYYDEALRGFSYMEYSDTGLEEVNIEAGEAHLRLFNTVLPAMFDQVISVASIEDAAGQNVDAVFVPEIVEFQLALPAKNGLGVYEVWILYNMRLLTSGGEVIADWVLTAYATSPYSPFRSRENGINEAALAALREFASSDGFPLNFAQVPEVRDWLNKL